MSQRKLILHKPFLGVQPCEIAFSQFLLLIGEQASGKSTIAKLIYFFEELPAHFSQADLAIQANPSLVFPSDFFKKVVRDAFHVFFGSPSNYASFSIEYQYTKGVKIKMESFRSSNELRISIFSLSEKFSKEIQEFARASLQSDQEIFWQHFSKERMFTLFESPHHDREYLIAGRSSIVGFSHIVSNSFLAGVEKTVEMVQAAPEGMMPRTGNERLFLDFARWSKSVEFIFGQDSIGKLLKGLAKGRGDASLVAMVRIMQAILKGQYHQDGAGEYIVPQNGKEKVYLKDASSGQQEVLRILQGLFLAISNPKRNAFMIIEEPEAHLFPRAQRDLVNAFALFLNAVQSGRLIITTHSPYILSCVNILLMAYLTGHEKEDRLKTETDQEISSLFWLDPDRFASYAIGGENQYCTDIKDLETGLVADNFLDSISEQLGLQFQHLYDLMAQNRGK
jgi:AAA15 family ATPase/GTPase